MSFNYDSGLSPIETAEPSEEAHRLVRDLVDEVPAWVDRPQAVEAALRGRGTPVPLAEVAGVLVELGGGIR